jgi:hypothetical protein
MDKTLLTDLKKKVFIRSALISLDSLDELLGLNNYLTADEILLEIFKKALREFEITEPLILEMPVTYQQLVCSCSGRPGWGEIKSNFTLYLDCAISEHRIILVPTSLPLWRAGDYGGAIYNGYYSGSSIPSPGAYQYFTDYQKPYVFISDIGMYQGTGEIYIKGIVNRPIVPDFLPDRSFNPDSKKSAIYWMDVETGGAKGNYFLDLCLVHLLDYIRQLKASISLPNMPVDVLSNVDSAYQEYRARCDQYALQSGWRGELLL